MDAAAAIITILILGGIYLIPSSVALVRGHQIGMVIVLNVLLGWTLVGWAVALAIACGDSSKRKVAA